jgi:hypothetical protein
MTINGAVKGRGTGERALGHPMNVLLWLANQQSAQGRGLKAGEIVATGTCTASIRSSPAIAWQRISAAWVLLKSSLSIRSAQVNHLQCLGDQAREMA